MTSMRTEVLQCGEPECDKEKTNPPITLFGAVNRTTYIQVDLDTLTQNVAILRERCVNKNIGLIVVVKAGAFMHGSTFIAAHCKSIGVERLAVATVVEGIWLRQHYISGPIHVFGNTLDWEMDSCVQYDLVPSISEVGAIVGMQTSMNSKIVVTCKGRSGLPRGSVAVKVDTGMSRNGCQPEDLRELMLLCSDLKVPVDSIFSHFSDAWDNPALTSEQLKLFKEVTQPYKDKVHLHMANSAAIIKGPVATDLAFVRPGTALWGLPSGNGDDTGPLMELGLRPILSIKATPCRIRYVPKGVNVGYTMSYMTRSDEWIATFALGFADGYWRSLSDIGKIVRDSTGEKCPVIGGVSMDNFSVRLSSHASSNEVFTIITADYDLDTSISGIAYKLKTVAPEVATRLSTRFPRVFIGNGHMTIVQALGNDIY